MVPKQESCASTEDENCDEFDCALWAKTFDTPSSDANINSIVFDREENIIAAGSFARSIQFGPEPLVGSDHDDASDLDAFIVSFDSAGNHRWSHQLSAAMAQEATSACVDSAGNIIVTGINSGSLNLGDDDMGPGIFVVKFDRDGNHLWSKGISGSPAGDSGFLAGHPMVKSMPDGDVILAGHFAGTLQFDDDQFTTYPADAYDIYVARLNGETGASRAADGGWVQRFKSQGADTLTGVAVHSSSNIIITGNFAQRIAFGSLSPAINEGMFLVNLNRDGSPAWARGFANAEPTALSVDTLGNISATGAYEHPTDFGGGNLPEWSKMAFTAQFDIAGNHRWSRGFRGDITTASIGTDANNNVILLGTVTYDVRIDDGEILYVEEMPSPIVIKLDPEGRTVWKRWFPLKPLGVGLAGAAETYPAGGTAIAGRAVNSSGQSTTIDFGTGPQPIADHSLFIAKLGK
ncbi:hypothetical protein WME73_04835 [Sorangium sp. So ce302]|uniref:hypothetical protein n=1 Tax=unclassified Sorangium TaxID=2621164 RepID=UPI003F605AE6